MDTMTHAASTLPGRQTAKRLALTVGPVLYHWPRDTLMRFYADIAESTADAVVLGETVCARRHDIKLDDWLGLARDLSAEGKQVLLATQTLVESEADLRLLRRLAEQHHFMVEAGDASALQRLAGHAPFALGPHINVYNRAALAEHAALGAVRWVAPVELSLDTLALINPATDPVCNPSGQAIATELFAFGRLPLAFSARCFTARHYGLNKDECEFRCRDDADGLLLASAEGQPFLVLNGTQTQSAATQCLIGEGTALRAAGVSRLRLSPCSGDFAAVVAHFDAVINHGASAADRRGALAAIAPPGGLVNGFAHHRPGMEWRTA